MCSDKVELLTPAIGQQVYKCPDASGVVKFQQMPCSPTGGGGEAMAIKKIPETGVSGSPDKQDRSSDATTIHLTGPTSCDDIAKTLGSAGELIFPLSQIVVISSPFKVLVPVPWPLVDTVNTKALRYFPCGQSGIPESAKEEFIFIAYRDAALSIENLSQAEGFFYKRTKKILPEGKIFLSPSNESRG